MFPHCAIWVPRVLRKVRFFVWLAARGVILTAENLRKKIIHASWCYVCKSLGEDVNHLLLHCHVANRLWRVILNPSLESDS